MKKKILERGNKSYSDASDRDSICYDDKKAYKILKRILDLVLSIVGIVICIVPAAIIAMIIRIDSPGPVIFVHNRIGKGGKNLPLLKFRTMYRNSDDMIDDFTPEQKEEWEENFKLDDDPRVTKVGYFLRKSSLDELPQLINILMGDLAIVGPRPIVKEELEKYGEDKEKLLSVTPGLTGYWQAYARNDCTYEQRMEMELHYVENANLWWDIKIIFATFGAVLRGRGAK